MQKTLFQDLKSELWMHNNIQTSKCLQETKLIPFPVAAKLAEVIKP